MWSGGVNSESDKHSDNRGALATFDNVIGGVNGENDKYSDWYTRSIIADSCVGVLLKSSRYN